MNDFHTMFLSSLCVYVYTWSTESSVPQMLWVMYVCMCVNEKNTCKGVVISHKSSSKQEKSDCANFREGAAAISK